MRDLKVIEFMLEDSGWQIFKIQDHFLTLQVQCLDFNTTRSLDIRLKGSGRLLMDMPYHDIGFDSNGVIE